MVAPTNNDGESGNDTGSGAAAVWVDERKGKRRVWNFVQIKERLEATYLNT